MTRFLRLLLIFGLVSAVAAQEAPRHPQRVYKVVFLIYEVEDGKRINERSYTLPVSTLDGSPRDSSMKVGNRVPMATAITTSDQTVYQYVDVGLTIDCNLTEQEGKFIVHGGVELSSLVTEQGANSPGGGNPVLRQVKENFTTLVSPGKPTLVTTMDDLNSKKRLQVEVTATKIE